MFHSFPVFNERLARKQAGRVPVFAEPERTVARRRATDGRGFDFSAEPQ